jgi:acyl-CoA hydrolase
MGRGDAVTGSSTAEQAWRGLVGARVLLPSGCGFPEAFVRQIPAEVGSGGLELVAGLVLAGYRFLDELPGDVSFTTWQYAPGVATSGRVSFLPLRYSQIIDTCAPGGSYPVDALVVHLAPPDDEGFCSLGVSPSYLAPLAARVPRLIGIINKHMPVTTGHPHIHVDRLDKRVELDAPLIPHKRAVPSDIDMRVAANVASLIADGATLQIGLGGIPEALPTQLGKHKDLGLFGMMTDGAMDLMKSGIVNGARYTPAPGAVEVGEVVGTPELFAFVNGSSTVRVVGSDYAMDPGTFARVPGLVALNSAIEVDLSGQVNAETIGHRIVSGAGGQCDYMQGAFLSEGGLAVIALPSTTSKGRSRIVHSLAAGSVVTTPRTAVSHVVTEHGIAALRGRSLEQRMAAMEAIAAPEHRSQLRESRVGPP